MDGTDEEIVTDIRSRLFETQSTFRGHLKSDLWATLPDFRKPVTEQFGTFNGRMEQSVFQETIESNQTLGYAKTALQQLTRTCQDARVVPGMSAAVDEFLVPMKVLHADVERWRFCRSRSSR